VDWRCIRFEITIQPLAADLDKARWMIQGTIRSGLCNHPFWIGESSVLLSQIIHCGSLNQPLWIRVDASGKLEG